MGPDMETVYVAQLRTEYDGKWPVVARAEFPTWGEAFAWLDDRRTDVALALGRYGLDPYRYELRIED